MNIERIDEHYVWLGGVSRGYLEMLPRLAQAQAVPPPPGRARLAAQAG
jgi:hypothetical protein